MQREKSHWRLYHPLKFGLIYCDHLQVCHVLAVYEDIMADFFSDNFFIHRVSEDYLTSAEIDIDFLDCFVFTKGFFYSSCAKITDHALYTDDRDLRLRQPLNKIVKLFGINLQFFSIDECFVDMATVLMSVLSAVLKESITRLSNLEKLEC